MIGDMIAYAQMADDCSMHHRHFSRPCESSIANIDDSCVSRSSTHALRCE